ncbi:MAG: hypothetical protein ACM3SU_11920 [Acidobacteriota bacterium]
MEDRIRRLEEQVAELASSLARVEARLERMPAADTASLLEPAVAETEGAPLVGPLEERGLPRVLSLLGRSLLILGGAYVFRMAAESGALPPLPGVLLGLLYAILWMALADRAGTRGAKLSAAFFGVTSALIAFPLLWEATSRFHALSAEAASLLVAGGTGLGLAIAWRQDLPALAWSAVGLALTAVVGLFERTFAILPLTAVVIAQGAATLWLAYGRRRWTGLRWPAAAAADLAVAALVLLASHPASLPPEYRGLTSPRAIAVVLLLPAAYLAGFAIETIARRGCARAFEAAQSAAAILVGFGGALAIAHASQGGVGALGAAGAAAAAVSYAVAFVLFEKRESAVGNGRFYSGLALLFLLISGIFAFPAALTVPLFSILAAAAALASRRSGRSLLEAHALLYFLAAAIAAGSARAAVETFASSLPGPPPLPRLGAIFPLLAAVFVVGALLSAARRGETGWQTTIPSAGASGLALLLAGALFVALAARALSLSDPGALAALRTGVLAAFAFLLAAAYSASRIRELRFLAWATLALAAIKLLAQDLPAGRPATLLLAFALLGGALIFAPRLLARRAAAPRGRDLS